MAGEAGEETASSDTADEDTGSTTGDEGTNDTGTDSDTDSDTGEDPPVLCDLATVETRTPEWVELLPQPVEGRDTAGDGAITAEGIFVGLTRVVDNVYAVGAHRAPRARRVLRVGRGGARLPGQQSRPVCLGWDAPLLRGRWPAADDERGSPRRGLVGTPISPDADFHEMNVDGPLVVAAGSWTRVIDPSGAELWRHALEPRGVGVSTFVAQFARDEGRIVLLPERAAPVRARTPA